MNTPGPLICVVGQTATGKSHLAIKLALKWDGEIICADSWTVRKHMDIGSAKPDKSDQLLVKHHLLDVVEPNDNFNAALFKKLALEKIDEVLLRGKIPFLVGGTGLYIDSVIYDYSFAITGTLAQRDYLNKLTIEELLEKTSFDGIDTSGVDVRNKRRLIRLIETNGYIPTKNGLRKNTLIIGIRADSNKKSYTIEDRVNLMLQQGLENEVKGLVDAYGWEAEGMRGIGYSQWHEYFLGHENIDQVRKNIVQATKNLSKRQMTWFKRNKSIHWFDNPVKSTSIEDLITTFLSTDISI